MINPKVTVELVNKMSQGNMLEHLGIEITELGSDFLKGKMPVDHRTVQPFGLLHGGASMVLAETLASIGGNLCVDPEKQYVVGLEINGNHIKSAKKDSGYVYGTAKAIHIGRKTQIWSIELKNEKEEIVCHSRMTLAVMDKP